MMRPFTPFLVFVVRGDGFRALSVLGVMLWKWHKERVLHQGSCIAVRTLPSR
jgi:hypothetical protein